MTIRLKTNIIILRSEREKCLEDIYIQKKKEKSQIHLKIEKLKDELKQKEFNIRDEIRKKSITEINYLKHNKIKGRTKQYKEIIKNKKQLILESKNRELLTLIELRERSRFEKQQIENRQYEKAESFTLTKLNEKHNWSGVDQTLYLQLAYLYELKGSKKKAQKMFDLHKSIDGKGKTGEIIHKEYIFIRYFS